jgi:signal transduction histidine kinase
VSLPRTYAAAEAGLAFVVGAVWFALSSLLVRWLDLSSRLGLAALIIVLDLVVVWALSHRWGIGYGVAVGVAGVVALDWYCIPPVHAATWPNAENTLALSAYLIAGSLLGQLAATARRRAQTSEAEARLLADEQAALRRVATLVATASPDRVLAAVAEEVGGLLDLELAVLLRYETDGTATALASWSRGTRKPEVGSRWALNGDTFLSSVLDSGRPHRVDHLTAGRAGLAGWLHEHGARSGIACPVVVEGRMWGVMVGASFSTRSIEPDTESRLGEFTELAGTAVSNAESRAELAASRARIVASGDQARQRIERDLHDGVQQRLVSLALDVRRAEAMAGPDQVDLVSELSSLRSGLVGAVDELRNVSHGIHPAILTEGGLRPALGKLARRSPVPVELEVRGVDRVPEAVEVGVYYVVSEAITNAIKHARADFVAVDLELGSDEVRLIVSDDGVGGANARGGSGLVGLTDRIHALGGAIDVRSPLHQGTRLSVQVPLDGGDGAQS